MTPVVFDGKVKTVVDFPLDPFELLKVETADEVVDTIFLEHDKHDLFLVNFPGRTDQGTPWHSSHSSVGVLPIPDVDPYLIHLLEEVNFLHFGRCAAHAEVKTHRVIYGPPSFRPSTDKDRIGDVVVEAIWAGKG
jgi:hypothetical protein